ncbi:MAG: ornithine cyclodeaminase family protein [Deltaproteobacteria bacterium]|nr:ornithine cyclodeaminase family protein [Deltaproteobacteria bacterium]
MTLILNNDDVKQVLTMDVTMEALEKAYTELVEREAVCRPRIDLQVPTPDPEKMYQWGTMEGGSTSGYFAIRIKSDIVYEQEYNGAVTQEKYCVRPGLFCGLILLTSIHNGEPLAILNDGHLQHVRVGADSGIGVKFMAREDAEVVGMIGSGGMARSHMEAFMQVRNIRRVQVYSPTKANREQYAREMTEQFDVEAVPLSDPDAVYKGADIIAGCTDSAVDIIEGSKVEEGTHIVSIGGRPDATTFERVDVSLRLGTAPAPWGLEEFELPDEYITYAARPDDDGGFKMKRKRRRAHGVQGGDKNVMLADLLSGKGAGRTSAAQITYSERGNVQGAQFYSVAGKVYELCRERGLGKEIPTEWLLQDIRD